jgi:hypothetical protein
VAVDRKDPLAGLQVAQDQPLMGDNPVLHHALTPPALDVVVSDDDMKAIIRVEGVEQVKNVLVGSPNLAKAAVLPELITVSNLDVGVALVIILSQYAQEQRFVLGKGIGPAVIAAMTVAEEDQRRIVVEGDQRSRL